MVCWRWFNINFNINNTVFENVTNCITEGQIINYYAFQSLWLLMIAFILLTINYFKIIKPEMIDNKLSEQGISDVLTIFSIILVVCFIVYSMFSINQFIKIGVF